MEWIAVGIILLFSAVVLVRYCTRMFNAPRCRWCGSVLEVTQVSPRTEMHFCPRCKETVVHPRG